MSIALNLFIDQTKNLAVRERLLIALTISSFVGPHLIFFGIISDLDRPSSTWYFVLVDFSFAIMTLFYTVFV